MRSRHAARDGSITSPAPRPSGPRGRRVDPGPVDRAISDRAVCRARARDAALHPARANQHTSVGAIAPDQQRERIAPCSFASFRRRRRASRGGAGDVRSAARVTRGSAGACTWVAVDGAMSRRGRPGSRRRPRRRRRRELVRAHAVAPAHDRISHLEAGVAEVEPALVDELDRSSSSRIRRLWATGARRRAASGRARHVSDTAQPPSGARRPPARDRARARARYSRPSSASRRARLVCAPAARSGSRSVPGEPEPPERRSQSRRPTRPQRS